MEKVSGKSPESFPESLPIWVNSPTPNRYFKPASGMSKPNAAKNVIRSSQK